MKKILLASTALLAFGAVSAQAAEPVKLSIGGFAKQQIGYVNNRDDLNTVSFDQQGFGQINFLGSTKLDNGLTIGVQVETIASQWNDSRGAAGARNNTGNGNANVRRAFLTVSSAYGQLIAGQREDYGFITGVSAPDVGWGLQGGDWSNYFTSPTNHAGYFDANNSRYTSRTDKITLVTPTFAGLSLGASYVPDIHQSQTGNTSIGSGSDSVVTANITPGLINRSDYAGDMYLAGVTYADTLAGVGVKANFDFGQYNIANLRTYQAGLQATYAGFTFGGSLFARDADKDFIVSSTTAPVYADGALKTGLNWDVGASYATGPYSVSLGYFHDTSKRSSATLTSASGGAADSTQVYALSGKYIVGPGIDWRSSVYYADFKNNNSGAKTRTEDNHGVAVITGLQVAF